MVNFSQLIRTSEHIFDKPYVFSSQVKQVFYSQDPKETGWFVEIRNQPREVFDMDDEVTESGSKTECFLSTHESLLNKSDDGQWVREDVDENIYVQP